MNTTEPAKHARKVTTSLVGPGERVVKVDGEYAGVITREAEGWMWTGDRKPHRTFTEAAAYVAEKKFPMPPTVDWDATERAGRHQGSRYPKVALTRADAEVEAAFVARCYWEADADHPGTPYVWNDELGFFEADDQEALSPVDIVIDEDRWYVDTDGHLCHATLAADGDPDDDAVLMVLDVAGVRFEVRPVSAGATREAILIEVAPSGMEYVVGDLDVTGQESALDPAAFLEDVARRRAEAWLRQSERA